MEEHPSEETAIEESQNTQEENQSQQDAQGKTWYPYITKAQFEKFISRLQSKVPEQVDRDYVRPIIRTPSMIYRFLRGVEAMGLIDRDQKPTERLHHLIVPESRKQAIAEVVKDLYPGLLEPWQESEGAMPDHEIVSFFCQRTGMGNDSASKMKMFFKFLLGEADFSEAEAPPSTSDPAPEAPPSTSDPAPEAPPSTSDPAPEAPPSTSDPAPEAPPSTSDPAPEAPAPPPEPAPSRRSGHEKSASQQRNGPQPSSPSQTTDRSSSSKPLSEAQKAYIDTLQKVVRINIDGDWDDDMIRLAFDRLERLFDRIKRG